MKQTLSVYPLFSIGICSETEPAPWQVWQLARRNSIFTAADADDFVLLSYQNEFTSSIDQDIVSHITQAIIDKDGAGLKEQTDAFRDRYLESEDQEEVRRMALITVSTIYASLLEMNGDIPDIQMNASVRKLENASTIDEINKHF